MNGKVKGQVDLLGYSEPKISKRPRTFTNGTGGDRFWRDAPEEKDPIPLKIKKKLFQN